MFFSLNILSIIFYFKGKISYAGYINCRILNKNNKNKQNKKENYIKIFFYIFIR